MTSGTAQENTGAGIASFQQGWEWDREWGFSRQLKTAVPRVFILAIPYALAHTAPNFPPAMLYVENLFGHWTMFWDLFVCLFVEITCVVCLLIARNQGVIGEQTLSNNLNVVVDSQAPVTWGTFTLSPQSSEIQVSLPPNASEVSWERETDSLEAQLAHSDSPAVGLPLLPTCSGFFFVVFLLEFMFSLP